MDKKVTVLVITIINTININISQTFISKLCWHSYIVYETRTVSISYLNIPLLTPESFVNVIECIIEIYFFGGIEFS